MEQAAIFVVVKHAVQWGRARTSSSFSKIKVKKKPECPIGYRRRKGRGSNLQRPTVLNKRSWKEY